MVAGEAVAPLELHAVAGSQHERPALLVGPPAPRALAEALGEGGEGAEDRARMKRPADAVGETRRLERRERRIDEQRSPVPRHLTERRDRVGTRAADHHEPGAARLDGGLSGAETSDLLAAEDSAEVADEADHRRAGPPERAERNRGAALVERHERSESDGDVGHAATLLVGLGRAQPGYTSPSRNAGATVREDQRW